MRAIRLSWSLLAWAGVFLVCPCALGQERVAQLTKVDGAVTITRAADGSVVQAQQVGPRVRNGSVYGGDLVETGTEAAATLVFSDGSEIRLEASTGLTVQEIDLSTIKVAAAGDRHVGRRIKVLAGKVWADVVPNSALLTEFETPSGVAAVKGTTLSVEVNAAAD